MKHVIFFLTLIPCLGPGARAQQPAQVSYEGLKVSSVDLVARPLMNTDAFQPLVAQKPGTPYSESAIQKSVAALQGTGQFSRVDVQVTPQAEGLGVTFVLEPAYYVGMIDFPGATGVFSYPRLLETVNYPPQEPYEQKRVQEGQAALERLFTQTGYFAARVQTQTKLDASRNLANITYNVTLNRRARIGPIQIIGPASSEVVQLKAALHSFRARLHGANLKEGAAFDPQRLQAATNFLQQVLGRQSYLAASVRLEPPAYDPESNRAAWHFDVKVGPKVLVAVKGARVSKRKLHSLVPIYEEYAFDRDLVEEGQRNLVTYFQSKGYFDAKVDFQTSDELSQLSLVYEINPGKRHRVVSVRITGNRHFSRDDLKDQIVVQKAGWFSRGKLSQDLVDTSVENLTAFYQNAGFESVQVRHKIADHDLKLDVTFEIAEGVETRVASLNVVGNKTQSIATLAPNGLNLAAGKPYSQSRFNDDRNQVIAAYLDLGYLGATLNAAVKPAPGRLPRVIVTYDISEGPQTRIAKVETLGGRHTRPGFILRNANVNAGAPLSEGKLLESESNLYNLGIFDWTDVSPLRPVTTQKSEQVLIRVHEAKRNSLSYGFGLQYTPRSGSLASGIVALPGLPTIGLPSSFKVIEKNLFSPLGSIEYGRRNLRGRAETASVAMLLSRLDQRGSFSYTDPQFRDSSWSSLLTVSAERTTQNPLFAARLGTASFQLEKILDAAKTKRLQFRYSLQRTSLNDLLIVDFVPPEDLSVTSSMLSATFIRDTRDKPLDAHRGVFQTVDIGISPKVIGSTDNFGRFFGQSAYYREVRPWMVWANNVRLGLVDSFAGSHVPISEKFFSGGADSLRGFPLNGAGPQAPASLCTMANDPASCTFAITVPTGGRELFIFNSEGRFPIPIKEGLGGVVFYDGGNVYNTIGFSQFLNGYSNSVGVGLRYQTPVGPVRVDVGQNLNPVPGLKSTQVFVTLGQSF